MGIDKRQKILDTAMRLFVEQGIQATPTSRIAKEASVATGTLFHHFPTKEKLINALYRSIMDQMSAFQLAHFAPTGEIREDIRQIWFLDIRWKTSHADYAHFLERYSLFHYASQDTIAHAEESFAHVINIFDQAIEKKMTKILCFDYLKHHYLWNLRMNVIIFLDRPDLLTDENIDKTFEIYWSGIAVKHS